MVDMKAAIVEDLDQRHGGQLNEQYGDHIKKHFGRLEGKQATIHDLQTASHNEVLQAHRVCFSLQQYDYAFRLTPHR